MIKQFHYLRKTRNHGRQIKYFIILDGQLFGCIQFSDAVWTIYKKYGHYSNGQIVENSRFLLLKRVQNLGSQVLKIAIKLLKTDWEHKTGIIPKLLISYVDEEKGFSGTVYKAANFKLIGKSFGKRLNRWGRNKNTSAKLVFAYKL